MNLLDSKIKRVRDTFSPTIGSKLIGYENAELLLLNGKWDEWQDLPIRLHTDSEQTIAVSWSKWDDLWLAVDDSLPFDIGDATIRWVQNSKDSINSLLGNEIHSVQLGRGEMSLDGQDIGIWTRLLIRVGDAWLEIFNALDENGYLVHAELPNLETVTCL